MRQYPTGEIKLPDIVSPVRTKDILGLEVEPKGGSKKLVIPTMKLFEENSPTKTNGKGDILKQIPQPSHSEELQFSKGVTRPRHDFSTDKNPKSLQSHFNYEHFTGNTKRNVPSQPELINLLSEELESRIGHEKEDRKTVRVKKEKCEHCRMTDGKHKHWCIVYLENQKTKDSVIFAERNTVKNKRKRVSFGEISFDAEGGNETNRKAKAGAIIKTPKMIRSSTTLDGLNMMSDRPDFSCLHREAYIQALAESRARRLTKLKGAYDFSTQSTKPFLFSYFDNIAGPANRLKNDFDCMKHIFGKVKVDKYYERLTGKTGKGFYTKP